MPHSFEEICGAVARGWCAPPNEHKEMDADLAAAISKEVWTLLYPDPLSTLPSCEDWLRKTGPIEMGEPTRD